MRLKPAAIWRMSVKMTELVEVSTLESVTRERDFLRSVLSMAWVRHRPAEQIGGVVGISADPPAIDDADLVRRIIAAFRQADATPSGAGDSVWTGFVAENKKTEYQTMLEGSHADITKMLRHPRDTHLFLGFDDLAASSPWANLDDPGWQDWMRQLNYDCLVRLAEAVGTVQLEHPETPHIVKIIRDVEELLIGLDRVFGFTIRFPNLFPGEVGLQTTRGVASFRAIQALYQAWRISQIVRKQPSAKVLEIGAGLGRTAYFARQFGTENYTTIDLPLTCVAQAYFLGAALDANALRLFGETGGGPLAILPPSAFFAAEDRYDLIVNADSMTEMGVSAAKNYWRAIAKRTPVFLSINHEFNEYSVREIINSTPGLDVRRTLYWLRRGYVEELITLPPAVPRADAHHSLWRWRRRR